MKYDFDIQPVAPEARFRDPKLTRLFGSMDASGIFVALFRDQRTAEAIAGASPRVQAFFLASGFGLGTTNSGAPDGCYPKEHEAERREVLSRVLDNLSSFDLTGEETNAFSFSAFIANAQAARPVEMALADAGPSTTGHGYGWRSSRDPAVAPASAMSTLRGQRLSGLSVPKSQSTKPPDRPASDPAFSLLKRAASATVICLALWTGAALLGLTGPIPTSEDLDPGIGHPGLRTGQ